MLIFRITHEHCIKHNCLECYKQLESVNEFHIGGIVDLKLDLNDPYYISLKDGEFDWERSMTRHTCPFNLNWVKVLKGC